MTSAPIPPDATACLLLADGKAFFGEAIGAKTPATGEICFSTGMVGYQETLTDPSFAAQIITFTFPHIGNVGCNDDDQEADQSFASGLVLRERPTLPSNFRSGYTLEEWLEKHNIPGICGIDTRALTRHIRKAGAQNAMILQIGEKDAQSRMENALKELKSFPSMEGMELAKNVTAATHYNWEKPLWKLKPGSQSRPAEPCHIVAIDYGMKHNILRSLAERGCKVTAVPAAASAEEILKYNPDGIFLSNGPGDPAATGSYAIPILKKLIDSGTPIFGICLGHQLLAQALGGKTVKMPQGHRGANHPVKNLQTGAVEITSQNHGFAVLADSLPEEVKVTHISLFDGTVEGLRVEGKPIFSVQYHPESSPGPHDSTYLFDEFVDLMKKNGKKN